MALYVLQSHGLDGSAVTPVAPVIAGDTFKLSGKVEMLRMQNSGAGPHVATIVGVGLDENGFVNRDLLFTVPALSGPINTPRLRPDRFGTTATVTYDAGSDTEILTAFVELNDDKGQAGP